MTATCPVCARDQIHGLLCHDCTSLLERNLSEVASILAELDVTLAKQARIEQGGAGGLARERNPIAEKAIDPRWVLGNVLGTWARDVSGETWLPDVGYVWVRRNPHAVTEGPYCLACTHRSCQTIRAEERRPRQPVAAQAAGYLLDSIDPIRRHPAVVELVDEVLDAIRLARRTIDRYADRQYLSVCRAVQGGVECTEELWASPAATEVTCRVCGTEYEVAERRAQLLKLAEDMLFGVKEASQFVGEVGRIRVSEASIRGYLHRKRLSYRTGTLIRLGDLLAIVIQDGEHTSERGSAA